MRLAYMDIRDSDMLVFRINRAPSQFELGSLIRNSGVRTSVYGRLWSIRELQDLRRFCDNLERQLDGPDAGASRSRCRRLGQHILVTDFPRGLARALTSKPGNISETSTLSADTQRR